MTQVTFNAEFRGGINGFVEFKLRRNGLIYNTFVIRTSNPGPVILPLEEGTYLVSVNGVATPDGTTIAINKPTSPSTPDSFVEGPIFKNYVLTL